MMEKALLSVVATILVLLGITSFFWVPTVIDFLALRSKRKHERWLLEYQRDRQIELIRAIALVGTTNPELASKLFSQLLAFSKDRSSVVEEKDGGEEGEEMDDDEEDDRV